MDTEEKNQPTEKYISYSNYIMSLSIEEYIKVFGDDT